MSAPSACVPRRATSVGTSTFSSTDSCGSRQWSWNTNPISWLRKVASCAPVSENGSRPLSRTLPDEGGSRAPRMYSSELLPLPDGPVIAAACPGASENDTSASTVSGPRGVG